MVNKYSQYNNTSSNNNNNHPSFSSTLLDAVYRSIDRGEDEMRQNYATDAVNVRALFKSEEEMANFQRACMIEKWMEKKTSEKVVVRTKSVTDLKKSRKNREDSSSSSSDSSNCNGFFSSSEADYSFPIQRPKPVRTGGSEENLGKNHRRDYDSNNRRNCADHHQSEQKQSGFLKTKSRALKIYGDLKKVKQPISPGGKLAGFLNTLFTGGNLKKPKSNESPTIKSANTSTCSSASSFSRSCLSKTPSSGGKFSNNGAKRSVRFYLVDEDRQQNNNRTKNQIADFDLSKINYSKVRSGVDDDELMAHVIEKNRRVEEAARDLLRNYQKKNQVFDDEDEDEDEDDDENDDAMSYASSDLFELDNLSAIGMDHQRYREELPVYETTHLENNRPIANGFML